MINSGIVASNTNLVIGDLQTVFSNTDCSSFDFCWVSETRGVLVYGRGSSGSSTSPYARVIDFASDGTITAGSEYSIDTSISKAVGIKCAYSPYHNQILVIAKDLFGTTYDSIKKVALTISGTSFTKSSTYTVYSGSNYDSVNLHKAVYDSTTHAVHLCFQYSPSGSYNSAVCSNYGTNMASTGTFSTQGNVSHMNICMVGSKIALQYYSGDYINMKLATISGTSYTWGSAVNVYKVYGYNDLCYDEKRDRIMSIVPGGDGDIHLIPITYSGTTLTVGTQDSVISSAGYPKIEFCQTGDLLMSGVSSPDVAIRLGRCTAGAHIGLKEQYSVGYGDHTHRIFMNNKNGVLIHNVSGKGIKLNYLFVR